MKHPAFKIIGNILTYFVVLGLIGSSFAKMMGEKTVVEAIKLVNFTEPLYLGILEFTCAVLLGIPVTRRIGIFMCTAYIGGVIVAENALNGKPLPGIFIMTVLWIGSFLREPDLFGFSFKK